MPLNTGLLRTPTGILKILEVIFVTIAIGVFRGESFYAAAAFQNVDLDFFICGILVAALINTTFLFFCYLLGCIEIQKTVMEMCLNFLFCALLLIGGVMAVDIGNKLWAPSVQKFKDVAITVGSFCLIGSITYFLDTLAAFRNYKA